MKRLRLRARPQQNIVLPEFFRPPYFADLSRWLKFYTSSLSFIDQIGDETRDLKPDYCITGNTTATITFDAAVVQIKYIEDDGTISAWQPISGAWLIPSVNIVEIILSDGITQIGYIICVSGSLTTIYDVEGGYNATLSTDSIWNTCLLKNQVNWLNKYGYNIVGGAYIPAKADLSSDALGNDLTYSGRAKLNSQTLGGRVAYFNSSAMLNATSITIYNRNYTIETYIYNNLDSTYRYFLGLGSSNILGLSSSSRIILRLYDGSEFVSYTGDPLATGWYKINLEVVWGSTVKLYINNALIITKTNTLLNSLSNYLCIGSLYGVNGFFGYMGKTTLTFTDNGEQHIFYGNNAIDSVTGISATNSGVTFPYVSTFTPQSTIDWLKYGGYILSGGEKIPNPQFSLPAGAIQVTPKGWNFPDGAIIDFDPTGVGEIGDLSHLFFNSLATIGNVLALPEIHPAEILTYADASNPYYWNEDMINFVLDNESIYDIAYSGYVYYLYKIVNNLTDLIVYNRTRTEVEQTSKLTKYLPQWSNLI